MATTSGVGSSYLDVSGLVSQLMTIEQRPLNLLKAKEASYQAKLSAYGSIKGALSSFQSTLSGLSNIAKFQALKATSSDTGIFTASASSTAVAGVYSLDAVTKLAQSQKLAATGQTDSTVAIGSGTLTFDFGTITGGAFDAPTGKYTGAAFTSNGTGTKTVTIDPANNSLQGIRDAINAAKIGVTATIINDGGASPYRLTLTSDSIGKTSSIKIGVTGDAALSNLLAYDPANNAGQNLAENATAQNAEFIVDGASVSKASNTIADVIQGVTLNLQKVTATPVKLTVERDTATVKSSLEGFVKAYNDLNKILGDVSAYNAATKKGAVLQGDSTVRSMQSQIRAVFNTAVSNTGGSLTTLSQIGVSFQKDGTLALDASKLDTAISNNFNDIASLFAAVGKASDSLVSYSSASSATKPGSYAVNVTTLATQGNIAGNAAAGLTITSGVDDALNFTVNGVSASVVLAAGTYTAAALAAEVQSKINGASALSSAGISVAVTQNAGVFTITSNSYGSASSLAVSGIGASNLLGGAPVATSGVDVAGTIDGVAATGSGQFLTSSTGNSTGLTVRINGGLTGARGTVNYSQGYAYTLNELATTFLASGGLLDGRTTGIDISIKDIGKQREALNVRLDAIEKRYRTQFTKLDSMLSSMNQTSSYLTQQLNKL
ncbi:flagellar filament capping protein FliD [Candidatus Ferrigenium straubiae]|jgi:flagellar hook-associated protein 2|uniref:flagellar filament capping protein FliD n=1 Tax=Candidatus Ferrigenium straubiae TaxID=2919506 RepID=UPI003F4ADFE4